MHKRAFYLAVMDELRVRHGIQSEVVPTDGPPGHQEDNHIKVTFGENEIEFYHTCGLEPTLYCVQWVRDSEFIDGETWEMGRRNTTSPEVHQVANVMREYFEEAIAHSLDPAGYTV